MTQAMEVTTQSNQVLASTLTRVTSLLEQQVATNSFLTQQQAAPGIAAPPQPPQLQLVAPGTPPHRSLHSCSWCLLHHRCFSRM